MALPWFRAADLQKLVVFTIFKSLAQPSADFGLVDLRKLVVFCDFQIARATLCGLWAGRPSKTRGFLRFSNRSRNPLRTLGWSTFENSWFFAIFKSPARPSADFGPVDLRKLVVFCDFEIARATLCGLSAGRPSKTRGFLRFQIARATLCGLWAGRPSKTRGFLRFSNRPRDPLRTLGWSTFENSWFFAIFKSPARPSADFGPVDLRKLVVFCDFEIARATLCGLSAGRPSKTRGFLRFQIARATLCGLWAGRPSKTRGFFAIFKSPARPSADFGLVDLRKLVVFCDFQIARATLCGLWAGRPSKTRDFLRFLPARPSAEFRVVKSLSSWRGAHFLEAVSPKPSPSQGDLLQSALDVSSKRCQAIGIASDTFLKNFSLSAHVRAQHFSLNFCYQTC